MNNINSTSLPTMSEFTFSPSIVDFSQDCDMAMHLVDQLLNLLTHQQHTRTRTTISNRRRLEEEEERIAALLCPPG